MKLLLKQKPFKTFVGANNTFIQENNSKKDYWFLSRNRKARRQYLSKVERIKINTKISVNLESISNSNNFSKMKPKIF